MCFSVYLFFLATNGIQFSHCETKKASDSTDSKYHGLFSDSLPTKHKDVWLVVVFFPPVNVTLIWRLLDKHFGQTLLHSMGWKRNPAHVLNGDFEYEKFGRIAFLMVSNTPFHQFVYMLILPPKTQLYVFQASFTPWRQIKLDVFLSFPLYEPLIFDES